jgi:hypothetical protein
MITKDGNTELLSVVVELIASMYLKKGGNMHCVTLSGLLLGFVATFIWLFGTNEIDKTIVNKENTKAQVKDLEATTGIKLVVVGWGKNFMRAGSHDKKAINIVAVLLCLSFILQIIGTIGNF